ncbi:MAG: hypothetical protein ACPGJV_16055 [Bacteriovoracaceae bacterium]
MQNGRLTSGGRHYGHLQVTVEADFQGKIKAILKPAYSLPIVDDNDIRSEQKFYNDTVIIEK